MCAGAEYFPEVLWGFMLLRNVSFYSRETVISHLALKENPTHGAILERVTSSCVGGKRPF